MSKVSHKFLAGFCMGIAEITPGISGATIAGLFNVYKEFVTFLHVFSPIKLKPNLKYFSDEINFSFIINNFTLPSSWSKSTYWRY